MARSSKELRAVKRETLLKLLIDTNTPASVGARVADSIIAHATKEIGVEDIQARLTALESAAEAPGQKH